MRSSGPVWLGVSLKMYFTPSRTALWCAQVRNLAKTEPAVLDGRVTLAVLPAFLALPAAAAEFAGTAVGVGAQNLSEHDSGAHTGEVSAADIVDIGCQYVEIGHAERRRAHGETDAVVAAKAEMALRFGLTPLLCVGETSAGATQAAARHAFAQIQAVLAGPCSHPIVIAYEPVWAIGQTAPADPSYISDVCNELRLMIGEELSFRLVYGGSAGPGLISELGDSVDGLFLGRFAHQPEALRDLIREAGGTR